MLAYCLPIKPYKSAFLNFGLLVSEFVTIFISLAYFQFRENKRTDRQTYMSFVVIACVCTLALFNLISIFIAFGKKIYLKRLEKKRKYEI